MKKSLFAGSTGEAYITRLQTPPGYLVRIPKPEKGYTHKTLRLREGADMATLLNEAVKWRNETYLKLHGTPVPIRVFHKHQDNSYQKITGVRKMTKVVKKKLKDGTFAEYRIPCLLAEISLDPGRNRKKPKKSRSKLFSLNKYTEEKASELAAAWRKEQEELLKHPE